MKKRILNPKRFRCNQIQNQIAVFFVVGSTQSLNTVVIFFLRSAGFFDPYFDPYQVESSLEQVDKTTHYTQFTEHIRNIMTAFDEM